MEIIEEILEDQVENDTGDVEPTETFHSLDEEEVSKEKYTSLATSGTSTGEPTWSPVMKENREHYREVNGEIFSLAGADTDDVALNLGAPLPHVSGWAIHEGMSRAASGTANSSYEDLFEIDDDLENILETAPKDVKTMVSLPRVALGTGESIQEVFGDPEEIFPNLQTGVFSGDIVDDQTRRELKDMFGFERVIEGYASSELAGLAAVAIDETSQMVPLIDNFIFEIIPDPEYRDEYGSEPVDIREVDQPVIGNLVITDPFRESFDFTRYQIGDKMKAYPQGQSAPNQDIVTLEFMGRSGEVLNFGGANVHEDQISSTLQNLYGSPVSWGVNKRESENSEGIVVELYVENPDLLEAEGFEKNLADYVPSMEEAYKLDVVDKLEFYDIESYDMEDDMKINRMKV
jgi:phenylacetate-coenzyme A ligase PaaK-like adenylate-forming protein